MLQLASILFGLVVSASGLPVSSPSIPLNEWQAEKGDRFLADTAENVGYIIHPDGRYTSMPIGSGQRKVVRYGGKTYNATTPSERWTAKSLDIQTDRQTFGASGRFLRLFVDGTESTSYGIHSVANIDEMLTKPKDERYKSMGCILVDDEVMDLLISAYKLNGNQLDVVTVEGLKSQK